MYTQNSLKDTKKDRIKPSAVFLFALAFCLYNPFSAIFSMAGMVGDTAVQIRLGMDILSSGRFITDEIYSWHEGLTFTAHETGWYCLMGLMYNLLKIWGVIIVGAVCNLSTAVIAVNYIKDRAHPLVSGAVMLIVPFLNGYPDYNVRPSVVSSFLIVLLITNAVDPSSEIKKTGIIFAVSSFLLGWFHGGILPVFFLIYAVFIVIDLICREFKRAGKEALFLAGGALLSLLNPVGIDTWLFGIRQSTASDIWAKVDEWQPMNFTIVMAAAILLLFIGFMTNDDMKSFKKETVTKICLISMFFIMTCIYKRFVLYLSLSFLLFAPESYNSLASWLGERVLRLKLRADADLISGNAYRILAAACAVMMAGVSVFYGTSYLPTGTMQDIEKMAGYDRGVADFLNDRGYGKVCNSFDTGSWLLFYGVPVHIDNRIDPYMREFSGVDHIRGKMSIDSIEQLDSFDEEYHPDAYVLNIGGGYSTLLRQIELYEPDRYVIVYDNCVTSNIGEGSVTRWVVLESVNR